MPEATDREYVAVRLFTAYCTVRQMNPADWPIIGEVKQAAWLAAADEAISMRAEAIAMRGAACDTPAA